MNRTIQTTTKLVTPPDGLAVSVEAVKSQVGYGESDFDSWFETEILRATQEVEDYTQRQLLSADFKMYLDQFPTVIELERMPVTSVSSISYVDENGVTQTLSTSDYVVDLHSEPTRITPAYNTYWPSARLAPNAVAVSFIAGYTSEFNVPAQIVGTIKNLVYHRFVNRDGDKQELIDGVLRSLDSLRWQ